MNMEGLFLAGNLGMTKIYVNCYSDLEEVCNERQFFD